MYRQRSGVLEVLLAHPGGPFWIKKDLASWTVPKGEIAPGEDPLDAAQREFHEETGLDPVGPFTALAPVKQPGGKIVMVWAFEGDCDPSTIRSNTFTLEWPPKSGQRQSFPEIDRAAWYSIDEARAKISIGQIPVLDELEKSLPLAE